MNLWQSIQAIGNDVKKLAANIASNAAILPPKIGDSWYKTGMFYDTNYPLSASAFVTYASTNNYLYATPIKILDNVTLTKLAMHVTTAQTGAGGYIGVYSANADGTPNQLLVASNKLDFSTVGAKTATISLPVTKGQVLWLAYVCVTSGSAATMWCLDNKYAKSIDGSNNTNAQTVNGYIKTGMSSLPQLLDITTMTPYTNHLPRMMFSV